MGLFTRMSNGWELAVSSVKVLNANKQLIMFPVLSGASMLLILGAFGYTLFSGSNWDTANIQLEDGIIYLLIFLYYIVNYFVAVFFNMALIHCTKLYFDGEEVTIAKGLQFSVSRIGIIFAWAVFSATVGVILKVLHDNLGWLGRLITAGISIAWGVGAFLVVPVLAYEKLGPLDALKRSAQLMKQKWGEGIGASFSFGLMFLFIVMGLAVLAYAVSYYINDSAGIASFVGGMLLVFASYSALQSIFISALYSNVNGNITTHFRQQFLDGLFEQKEG